MSIIQKCLTIAIEAHERQTDKNGKPYALHVLSVMQKGKTEDEQAVGILHDLVEDTDWTFERLRGEGIPENIVEALKLLTHTSELSYDEYVAKIIKSGNKLAIQVKLNDLEDNMDVRRLKEVTEKDMVRLNKYLKVYKELLKYK